MELADDQKRAELHRKLFELFPQGKCSYVLFLNGTSSRFHVGLNIFLSLLQTRYNSCFVSPTFCLGKMTFRILSTGSNIFQLLLRSGHWQEGGCVKMNSSIFSWYPSFEVGLSSQCLRTAVAAHFKVVITLQVYLLGPGHLSFCPVIRVMTCLLLCLRFLYCAWNVSIICLLI